MTDRKFKARPVDYAANSHLIKIMENQKITISFQVVWLHNLLMIAAEAVHSLSPQYKQMREYLISVINVFIDMIFEKFPDVKEFYDVLKEGFLNFDD